MTKWQFFRYLLLLLFLVTGIYEFSPHVKELQKLYILRESVNFGWIGVALLAQIAQYAGEGYFTKTLYKIMQFDIKTKDAFRIATMDVFATHLLPLGQFGSVATNFYFLKKLGIETQAILFFNLVWGVVTACVLFAFLILTSLTIQNQMFSFPVHSYFLVLFTIAVIFFLVLGILLLRSTLFRRFFHPILKKINLEKAFSESREAWKHYKNLFFKQKKKFIGLIVLKDILYFFGDVLIIESCFLALHSSPSFPLVVFAYIVSLIAGYITLTPAGLGSTDATLGVIFLSSHVSPAVTLGVILLYRLVSFLFPIPFGGFSYFLLNRDLKVKKQANQQ